MALDLVWAHPEDVYFATERERVAHVCDEREIDHEALSAKLFRGRDGASSARRFPIFICPGVQELVFCDVDSRFETNVPFAAHLRRYMPLLTELLFFVAYVTTTSTRLGKAQTVFERMLSNAHKWLTKVADPDRLLVHFRDRKLFEKRETDASIGSGSMRCTTTCTVFPGDISPELSPARRPPVTGRFWRKSPRRTCPTGAFPPSFYPTTATYSDASRRRHERLDEPQFGERSKKGPFTSVSMEAFTNDTVRTRSNRAVRPGTWRIDPVFGVRGGAGATPVSVDCAATNPILPRSALSWVTPAPPPRSVEGLAMRIPLPFDRSQEGLSGSHPTFPEMRKARLGFLP